MFTVMYLFIVYKHVRSCALENPDGDAQLYGLIVVVIVYNQL